SGGGPFALACAALALGRVTRVGVASGAGPFGLVPGALAALDETDTAARALLPDDPEGAAAGFAAGFAPLATLFGTATDDEVAAGFGEAMSARDTVLLAEPALRRAFVADMREALRGGTSGGGWDNVAWVGDWSFPLDAVRCPVHLWYGDEDRFAPLAHGEWLAANLPDSHLTVRPGEGHLGIYEHIDDVLAALTR
ncbi:MAG: alpha/beta hydrolase, partial [Nocardioidaceae bacterium]|nr:alpha/beta hydrolase [Nocardioidaceae bacterium]